MRVALGVLLSLVLAGLALAQDVTISASDTTQSVLAARKGQRVTVRLRSGQELTGTVRDATPKLVVIAAVSGREFFDAVVPLEAVEAVFIRTK
jgi:hypothetical protein